MTANPPQIDICPKGFALVKPSIVDFLKVCAVLPDAARREYEAFHGRPYDVEQVALQFATAAGPSWALLNLTGEPIIIGGFTWIREKVWQDWLFSTPTAWTDHWRTVSKVCRRVIDRMMETEANRIQCIALASKATARAWYRCVGYEYEGCLKRFGAGGEDVVMYARVK
jgi:hypothetical protein